jgi:hypothetical protein
MAGHKWGLLCISIYPPKEEIIYTDKSITIVTQWVPLAKQEWRTLLESTRVHLQYLVGFVLLNILFSVQCFVDHCLSFWPLCCLYLIYGFRLLLWYLQTFLSTNCYPRSSKSINDKVSLQCEKFSMNFSFRFQFRVNGGGCRKVKWVSEWVIV